MPHAAPRVEVTAQYVVRSSAQEHHVLHSTDRRNVIVHGEATSTRRSPPTGARAPLASRARHLQVPSSTTPLPTLHYTRRLRGAASRAAPAEAPCAPSPVIHRPHLLFLSLCFLPCVRALHHLLQRIVLRPSFRSATSSSDEPKAAACVSEVLRLSALRSSAFILSCPLLGALQRSWPR